jgi:hypothetical protein
MKMCVLVGYRVGTRSLDVSVGKSSFVKVFVKSL